MTWAIATLFWTSQRERSYKINICPSIRLLSVCDSCPALTSPINFLKLDMKVGDSVWYFGKNGKSMISVISPPKGEKQDLELDEPNSRLSYVLRRKVEISWCFIDGGRSYKLGKIRESWFGHAWATSGLDRKWNQRQLFFINYKWFNPQSQLVTIKIWAHFQN